MILGTTPSLSEFQSGHSSGTGGEFVPFDPHTLQHGDEEVCQGGVVLFVEGEVLPVSEAAPGKENGKVGGIVGVGVAEVAAVQHHRGVEQVAVAFLDGAQAFE